MPVQWFILSRVAGQPCSEVPAGTSYIKIHSLPKEPASEPPNCDMAPGGEDKDGYV